MAEPQLFVAFWRACSANWYWGYPIAFWTDGPFCHSELVFGPVFQKAMCFSATIDLGVRWTLRDVTGPNWEIIPILCAQTEYDQMLAKAELMAGAQLGYDVVAFANFAVRLNLHAHLTDERFCSESTADVLRAGTKLAQEKRPDYNICPNELYGYLVAQATVPLAFGPKSE
jgi:hypothetical protein